MKFKRTDIGVYGEYTVWKLMVSKADMEELDRASLDALTGALETISEVVAGDYKPSVEPRK